MLEAWENAETVWYPFVWEETKDASNVIDYNIREEQTIDTSAVINGNNDTTTGIATVIPWVNAPKLIASTSIIWDLWGSSPKAIADISIWTQTYPWDTFQLTSITLTNEWWAWFTESSWAITVGKAWIYMINLEVWVLHTSSSTKTITVKKNWSDIISLTSPLNGSWWIDKVVSLSQWDVITLYCTVNTSWAAYLSWTASISFIW